jgi:hypothetical protein
MRNKTYLVCFWLLSGLLLQGCATNDMQPSRRVSDLVPVDQISVPAKFETTPLTAAALPRAVQPCLPWLITNDGPGLSKLVADIEKSKTMVVVYGHPRSGNLFVMTREQGFCVQRTTTLLPILAAETLLETAHPTGMPEAVHESWNRQIAQRLAVVGQVRVAYPQVNGNAYIVQFWQDAEGSRLRLKYSHTFKKAGEWEKDLIDLQFSHPQANGFLSVGSSAQLSSGTQEKIALLDHRLKPAAQRNLLRP